VVDEITVKKLMEFYLDTLTKSGLYLLNEDDDVIEYNIFEEFDIGVVSFFHIDNLKKLESSGLISKEVMDKSYKLREKVINLQQSEKWNIEGVRCAKEWREILELSDEIKSMLKTN
jgi:hypothetical protein